MTYGEQVKETTTDTFQKWGNQLHVEVTDRDNVEHDMGECASCIFCNALYQRWVISS